MSAGRVITCQRCHRRARHRGRGLCGACYQKLTRLDRLDQFERTTAIAEQTSMYCLCPTPSPVRIGLFQATFCDTCARAIRGVT